MKKQLVSITLLMALTAGFNVNAADDLDEVTMEIATKEVKRGHKMKFVAKQVINEYMLENGDVTQEELDAYKAEKQAGREELKALKEAGDTDGFEAKLAELKAVRAERKTQMKEYVENNEELKTAIQERKAEMKEERKRRREERKNRKEG